MFYSQIQPLMQSASNQNQHRANSSTNDGWKVGGFLGSLTRKDFALLCSACYSIGPLMPLTSPCTELTKPPHSNHGRKDGKATGAWGAAPAPQAPAGPCLCPTGWDPELAPSCTHPEKCSTPAASRDFQLQWGCRCLQDWITLSTANLEPDPTPEGSSSFAAGKAEGSEPRDAVQHQLWLQRWPFPSRAALPPQESHTLHFSGLTHHSIQMQCPVVNPTENLLTHSKEVMPGWGSY